MTTETSASKQYKPSPVAYKKTTLKSNYFECPCNGMIVGKVGKNKGKLILAIGKLRKLRVIDPDTGKVLEEYGLEHGVNHYPDDVAEGRDGTLFFTMLFASETIGYIRPDGTHGSIKAKFWNNSIAVSKDQKWLYSGCLAGNDQLIRWKLESNGLPKEGAEPEVVAEGIGWSNSMDSSDDGFMYGVSNLYGKIRRINPETKEIVDIYDNLEFPSSVEKNDATGIFYTSEFYLGYISRIDPKIKNPLKAKRVIAKVPPCLDNVAVMDGPKPRIFGSSFVEGIVFECYENGDPIRIIYHTPMMPESIQILKGPNSDQYFLKDWGRVQEWFPAESRLETIAWGNIKAFWEDETFKTIPYAKPPLARGPATFPDVKQITALDSVGDMATVDMGLIMQLTSEGHLLVGGGFGGDQGSRVNLLDPKTRKVLRIVKDIDYMQDAIMVGQDIYVLSGTTDEWFIPSGAPKITRVTPDNKRETVFTGKALVAFARNNDIAFASDRDAGIIYQVVKDGKWLAKPTEVASGLKGPTGMAIANDGNLLVMENNEGRNGRMLKVDLKTKEITVLADGLGVDRSYAGGTWFHLRPHAVVAQSSDGAIYFTEPGTMSFSVLRGQN